MTTSKCCGAEIEEVWLPDYIGDICKTYMECTECKYPCRIQEEKAEEGDCHNDMMDIPKTGKTSWAFCKKCGSYHVEEVDHKSDFCNKCKRFLFDEKINDMETNVFDPLDGWCTCEEKAEEIWEDELESWGFNDDGGNHALYIEDVKEFVLTQLKKREKEVVEGVIDLIDLNIKRDAKEATIVKKHIIERIRKKYNL